MNSENDTALQSIRSAEKCLREKRNQDSLDLLRSIEAGSLSPEEQAYYNLIYAEVNLTVGNYNIREPLEQAIAYYRGNNDLARIARAKYLQGWHLISLGRYFDAREELLESHITFKRIGDISGLGRTLNRLSYIAHQVGEFGSAIAHLEKCIELYSQNNDQNNVASVSLNLALLYMSLGHIDNSISLYSQISDVIVRKSAKSAAIFHIISAIPHAFKGEFEVARSTIASAEKYLDGLNREQAIYHDTAGLIRLMEGEYDDAVNYLQDGLGIAVEIAPDSDLVTSIKRRMADAFVGLGDFASARKFADEALALAKKLNERAEIAACHRVYAMLEAYAGNTDATRHWFDRALDLYSIIGSRHELAITRYLAGISGYYADGERHALLYLAREYFQSENVERYVTKINRELAEALPMKARPAHENNVAPTIICHNPTMVQLVDTARHVAPSTMSVLLTGPTGCGKDLFARFIHHHSGRPGRFVSVNAAAIPENMVESELFGYTRGAFTGAASTTSGWIEEADGGTFYLNEIADSSPELQAKLLDVIENRRICRLGERQEREIDCRIIAATNHDLEKLIDTGRFRLDLYHRLNEIPLHLPGLAERSDDIKYLIEHFMKSAGVEVMTRPDRDAFDRLAAILAARSWPGNVRELEIEVRRLILLSRKSVMRMLELTTVNRRSKKDETLTALERAGWNRREAARALGVSESTVRHRIKTFKLTPNNKS